MPWKPCRGKRDAKCGKSECGGSTGDGAKQPPLEAAAAAAAYSLSGGGSTPPSNTIMLTGYRPSLPVGTSSKNLPYMFTRLCPHLATRNQPLPSGTQSSLQMQDTNCFFAEHFQLYSVRKNYFIKNCENNFSYNRNYSSLLCVQSGHKNHNTSQLKRAQRVEKHRTNKHTRVRATDDCPSTERPTGLLNPLSPFPTVSCSIME